MDIFTPEQQQLIDSLEVYAQAEVAKATKPLQDLIDLVNSCVEIKLVNGSVVSEINLSAFELEALAMRIPAECSRLQSQLNQYNVKNMFRDMKMDAKVWVFRSSSPAAVILPTTGCSRLSATSSSARNPRPPSYQARPAAPIRWAPAMPGSGASRYWSSRPIGCAWASGPAWCEICRCWILPMR